MNFYLNRYRNHKERQYQVWYFKPYVWIRDVRAKVQRCIQREITQPILSSILNDTEIVNSFEKDFLYHKTVIIFEIFMKKRCKWIYISLNWLTLTDVKIDVKILELSLVQGRRFKKILQYCPKKLKIERRAVFWRDFVA